MSYKGCTAIVTGGASGIGKGITEHLLSNGCDVVIADINKDGESIAQDLSKAGSAKCYFQTTDVTSWKSVVDCFAFAKKTKGRIDFVFANAGIAQMRQMRANDPTYFATTKIDDLDTLASQAPNLKVIDVNLDGVLYTVYAALAYFRKQDLDANGFRGKMVLTGSNASFYPFPNDVLYSAAKHGVAGITKSLGVRVFDEGITVNALGPSIVPTALAPQDWLEGIIAEGRHTPMTTLLKAIDACIDGKSKISGHMIECCGQRTVVRKVPEYIDDIAESCMNEFWSVDDHKRIMNLEGSTLELV